MVDIKHLKLPREQYDQLKAALDAGWRLETDPAKIHARYTDLDLAEQVPRCIMYIDIGALMSRIHQLEGFLVKLGYLVDGE